MGCTHHPERTHEIVRCAECLRPFCRDCVARREQFYYCHHCRPAAAAAPALLPMPRPSPMFDERDCPPQSEPPTPAPPPVLLSREIPPASLLRRAMAFVVDAGLVGFVVTLLLSMVSEHETQTILLVMFGLPLVYEALFVQETGQTLGKSLLGVRVVSKDGRPVTHGQAWARGAFKIGQLICCGLSFAAAFASPLRRGLHDLAAGTRVVLAADVPSSSLEA